MTDEPNNVTDQPDAPPEDAAGRPDAAEVHQVEEPWRAVAEPVAPPGDFLAGASPEKDSTGPEADRSQPAEIPIESVAEALPEQPAAETTAEPRAVADEAATCGSPEPSGNVVVEGDVEEAAKHEPAGQASGEAVAEAPAEEPPAELPLEPVLAEAEEAAADETAGGQPAAPVEEEPDTENMGWYILKVQSNREDSIREGLLRRVAIAGLDRHFGQVIVPTEKVTEFKGGKKRVTKRKLYPGYLVVQMEINDDTWFLVRETPGIGDFTGAAGHPSPMLPHEVARIVAKQEEKSEKAPKLKIAFREGERVKIKEGTFESFEGDVDSIDETNGRVTVMINIFGRSTPVELEYWQIEAL